MKRSKRIEALDQRAVNKDGFIDEWPEMGFVAMKSPYDPMPSVKSREWNYYGTGWKETRGL